MITVVIPTHESERPLVHTLTALVPAAVHGLVREVIVADAGSTDETAKVADLAGCNFLRMSGARGTCLAAGAAAARAGWLLFLQPGSVPGAGWMDEVERFIREDGLAERHEFRAAVFRPSPSGRSTLSAVLALTASALRSLPKPAQGLLIAKSHYITVGGHGAADDPETDLLRRLGRRRIVTLDCAIASP